MSAALVFQTPAAAAVTITAPHSTTPVASSDLDGNPLTGAWSDAASFLVPLENGELDPYGSATLYVKHDGMNYYARIDGKIDVPWTSPTGDHFWLGWLISPSTTTGHHKTGQDLIFFGETSYPSVTYPLTPIDASGSGKPPLMDTQQDAVGMLKFAGTTAPYSFTAEWKRALDTGDSQDVMLTADGSALYNLYITTDSNRGGSEGGAIDHGVVTNANTIRFQAPPPPVVHDAAITAVSASPLSVLRPPDLDVNIVVTVANQGTEPETFTVSAFAGTVTAGAQQISLPVGGTQTLTFALNTASLIDGSYLIRATAETIPGEIDTSDNSMDDGNLVVATTPFDYHVSVSPSSATVKQGESTSAIVTVTLDTGLTQTVTLGGTELPSGATVSFSPPSGNPTYTSTMTITTSLSIAAGTYPISIAGSPSGATPADEVATFTLTVSQIVHDVVASDVTASPLNVLRPPDIHTTISVVVSNMGTEIETFSVTAFVGAMALPSQTVSNLGAGMSQTSTFTVNTSTLADGSYLIRAEAVLAGDANPANNSKDDGTLVVRTKVHNLAVTAVTPSATIANVGDVLTVTVTVANQGDFDETAVVHVYYDSNLIGELTGTVAAGASMNFDLTWNTAMVMPGTYTISGHVVPVAGETDIADNMLTDGTVRLVQEIVADFTWTGPFGDGNLYQTEPVAFTAIVTGGTPPYTFSWTFGDGTSGTGDPVTHTYAALGDYPVTLTVTDNAGGLGTASHTVHVQDEPRLARGKLSWTHHLKVSAGVDQVFTAVMQNPSDGTIYAYTKVVITPVDRGAAISVFSPITQLAPGEFKKVSFTISHTLFTPGMKYTLEATIWYNITSVEPIGSTPVTDVAGYVSGNSKTGSFATV